MKKFATLLFVLIACASTDAQVIESIGAEQWAVNIESPKEFVKKPALGKNRMRIATYSILPEPVPRENKLERWDSRIKQITHILKDCHVDAVGTQRAMRWQMKQLAEASGYSFVGNATDSIRPSAATKAILYNPEKFKLVAWGDSIYPPESKRDSIGLEYTWAHFKEKQSKKDFYMFNVMMRTKAQAEKLLLDIAGIAGKKPVVVTSDIGLPIYKAAPGVMRNSAYKDAFIIAQHKTGKEGTVHDFRSLNPTRRYDYIHLSPSFTVDEYDTTDEELTTIRPGSDHLPILVDLTFGK